MSEQRGVDLLIASWRAAGRRDVVAHAESTWHSSATAVVIDGNAESVSGDRKDATLASLALTSLSIHTRIR